MIKYKTLGVNMNKVRISGGAILLGTLGLLGFYGYLGQRIRDGLDYEGVGYYILLCSFSGLIIWGILAGGYSIVQ